MQSMPQKSKRQKKTTSLSHFIEKEIIDVKCKTIKLSQENRVETVHDLGSGAFLDLISSTTQKRKKWTNWTLLNDLCFVKDIKRMESYRCGGKYFQILIPNKGLVSRKILKTQ